MSVVLLERGRWHSPFEERKDDLVNQRNSEPRRRLRPGRGQEPARIRGLEGRERVVSPSQGEYSTNASCVGGGHLQLRRPGLALHGEGLPDALDLRSGRRQAPSTTGRSATTTSSRSTRRPSGRSASPATSGRPLQGSAPEAAADAAHGAEPRVRDPEAGRDPPRPPSLRHPAARNTVPRDGRSACMRCRWCVGFACEVNAKNGTHNTVIPRALATGNCRAAHRVHGEGDPPRRARARRRASRTSTRTTGSRSRPPTWWSSRAARSSRPASSCTRRAGSSRTASATGYDWVGRNLQRPHLHRRGRPLRAATPTTTWGPAPASPSATTTTATPAWRGAPCWPTSSSGCPIQFVGHEPARRSPLGQGPQGLHAPLLPAARHDPGAHPGDALVRLPRAGRPEGQGLLGHSRAPPLRRQAPPHDRGREPPGRAAPRPG